MKRILVFLGLKVAEIGGVVGVFALSSYCWRIFVPEANYWAAGAAGILGVFVAFAVIALVVVFLYEFVTKNWQWSKRITDK